MNAVASAPAWSAQVQASADRLRSVWGDFRPGLAVVLGSGWAGMVEGPPLAEDVPYSELPAFPALGIAGHQARVRLVRLAGPAQPSRAQAADGGGEGQRLSCAMLLMGREHAYEHGDAAAMRGALQTAAAVGCSTVVLTNAAGSLRQWLPAGSLMALSDHINMVQRSPLQDMEGSRRFVDMTRAYDPELRREALGAAAEAGVEMHEGVYAWVMGPQFETPAEIRMLEILGADAVGMSTVPEAIIARHAGMKVLALSLITNMAAGLADQGLSHEQTLAAAARHAELAARALRAILPKIAS